MEPPTARPILVAISSGVNDHYTSGHVAIERVTTQPPWSFERTTMRAFSHFFFAALLALVCTLSVAEEAGTKQVKMSVFAPAKETEAELKYFLGKIEQDLGNKDNYSAAEQKRVGLDASTVAVLSLVLGHHDEKTALKQSASRLIEVAGELADNSDDYDAAKDALAALKKVVADPPKGSP